MVTKAGSVEHRMWLLNQFHECVRREVVPAIHADLGGQAIDVITAGASIGAFNAVPALRRYPDVFDAAALAFVPGLEGPQLDPLRQPWVVLASGEGEWQAVGESWGLAEVLGAK